VDPDGTIHGAPTTIPISEFLSPEAKAAVTERLRRPPLGTGSTGTPDFRKSTEASAKDSLDGWLKLYPSNIEDTTIDGVHVLIVTPSAGVAPENRQRVLIGAHQGGFVFGDTYSAEVEAVPLAGRGRIRVIAVDYRKAPEFTYPAASEDMERVYRHVLKSTRAANVGIYGCSAGGTLVAESVVWFQTHHLPRPGAIGIMCSGAMKNFWFGGDSQALSSTLNARPTPKADPGAYFKGADMSDPAVTPGTHPEVLRFFPPTLLVSGTRDIALSNVLMTHTALLEAGVDARLFVEEGLGHGQFFMFPGTPESATAYDIMWNFFDSQLKR
jgi:acetyl esterase/lipase